jgi:glucose 1-dehydrogenase
VEAIIATKDSFTASIRQIEPVTSLGDDEVLCSTRQIGICGTDREILHSGSPCCPKPDPFLVLGHECLAQIAEVGRKVTGFSAGDWVVPAVRRPFERNHPRADLLPFGSFTERGIHYQHGFACPAFTDQPEHLFKVKAAIEPIAVFTEPLSITEKAVHESITLQKARLGTESWTSPTPRVLVTGMGPIGFAAMISCLHRNWQVTMLGRDASTSTRARLAQDWGARYSNDLIHHPPNHIETDGFDLVLECTGDEKVMVDSAGWLASCGVMVWVGSSFLPQPRLAELARLMGTAILRNHLFLGTVNAARRDFASAIQLLESRWQTDSTLLKRIVTETVSFADSLPFFQGRKKDSIKTVIRFD